MKRLFSNLGLKLRAFMSVRNGMDEFSLFLCAAAAIVVLLSLIPHLWFLRIAALILWIWSLIRCFSKNVYGRRTELQQYYAVKNGIHQFFRLRKMNFHDRKTHRYFSCPHCKATIRIKKPEKRHKISIRCPKCGRDFVKKA